MVTTSPTLAKTLEPPLITATMSPEITVNIALALELSDVTVDLAVKVTVYCTFALNA